MNTRLEIRDVRLHFGEIEALRGVDVDVPSQGITGLIGPNGAGKTALLNTVSGIYRPQSGQVLLDGENLVGLAPHSVAKAGVGRSFQHLELFPRLTVTEKSARRPGFPILRESPLLDGVLRSGAPSGNAPPGGGGIGHRFL